MTESFEELFEESVQSVEMVPGSIVVGTVVDIDSESVTVHVGLKSEGVIPREQFVGSDGELHLAVGDQVKVQMEVVDDGFGETRLSREKAKRAETWDALSDAFEREQPVTGTLVGRVKGGFTVDINDVRAFLPGSLLDARPVRENLTFDGEQIDVIVIKLDPKRANVVVSRRAVVEAESSEEREALLESLEEGKVLQGVVKNLKEYGAFVDLGGIDGLLHITDMAWRRIRHPSEIVEVGDKIDVKVLSIDRERNRIGLGMKQLGDDPWIDIASRYPKGTKIPAVVTNITDYGCFAEIEPGVEGLVHVSEMDWTNRNVIPSKVVTVGEGVEVMILDIDEERRRVSLGVKQCRDNPWVAFSKSHSPGDRVRGQIKSITDFGIFIGLVGEVDGLVHLSDLSWSETGDVVVRRYSKGEEVDAVVLDIDMNRERIALGIKQLESDVFASYIEANPQGSDVTGVVTEVEVRQAIVRLSDGVEGVLSVSEMSSDHVADARYAVSVGDEIGAKVAKIDVRNRYISLSIKAKEREEEKAEHKAYREKEASRSTTAKLGDLIKSQLTKSSKGSK